MFKLLIFACFVDFMVDTAHLPGYLTICSMNDNFKKCVIDNVDKSWKDIAEKGDKSLKLANLNPMKIKKMNLQASDSLQIEFNDLAFHGLGTCTLDDIVMDISKEDFSGQFKCELFEMIGKYILNGKIMVLPIQGNGNVNVTIIKPAVHLASKLELVETNGEKYYNIIPIKTTLISQRVYYKLDNLFNGDKVLGEQMNNFLNENWKEVFEEIGPGVSTIIGFIAKTVVNAFFNNIPINELHH